MFDLIREIAQTMRNNRLRTILTGVSVSWGVFMLIVLLGAARGVRNQFADEVNTRPSNFIQFWRGMTSMPYQGYKEGRPISLKNSDLPVLESENAEIVEEAITFASIDTAKIRSVRDQISGGFEAVYPKALTEGYEMTHGRFINTPDIDGARRSMVINDRNARQLFGSDSAAVGQTVESLGLAWTIVGVYTHRWRDETLIPYTTYKALTGNSDEAYSIKVMVKGLETEADGTAAEEALRRTLAKQHTFNPDDSNALWTWNSFNSYLTNLAAMNYLNLAVWVIGIFTLLTGIVGVSNIMFVSVRERTHEIGIRRAIGAKPRNILVQILSESVAITALFGYFGIVAGTLALQLVTSIIKEFAGAAVDISLALQVTAALVLAGALAGLFPALKAIKVKPVEALRDE